MTIFEPAFLVTRTAHKQGPNDYRAYKRSTSRWFRRDHYVPIGHIYPSLNEAQEAIRAALPPTTGLDGVWWFNDKGEIYD